jgi:hypothetical protein
VLKKRLLYQKATKAEKKKERLPVRVAMNKTREEVPT